MGIIGSHLDLTSACARTSSLKGGVRPEALRLTELVNSSRPKSYHRHEMSATRQVLSDPTNIRNASSEVERPS